MGLIKDFFFSSTRNESTGLCLSRLLFVWAKLVYHKAIGHSHKRQQKRKQKGYLNVSLINSIIF